VNAGRREKPPRERARLAAHARGRPGRAGVRELTSGFFRIVFENLQDVKGFCE
jgi:hypothetical protein